MAKTTPPRTRKGHAGPQIPPPPPGQPLFTIPEAASVTRMPVKTIKSRIADGSLPSVKPGRHRLITRKALAAFLGVKPSELDTSSAA